MKETLDNLIDKMRERIIEVLGLMDLESATKFVEEFDKKLKELYEQNNIKEDSGASG
jgi:hypothetical protein